MPASPRSIAWCPKRVRIIAIDELSLSCVIQAAGGEQLPLLKRRELTDSTRPRRCRLDKSFHTIVLRCPHDCGKPSTCANFARFSIGARRSLAALDDVPPWICSDEFAVPWGGILVADRSHTASALFAQRSQGCGAYIVCGYRPGRDACGLLRTGRPFWIERQRDTDADGKVCV
jgi:hypothetical protein